MGFHEETKATKMQKQMDYARGLQQQQQQQQQQQHHLQNHNNFTSDTGLQFGRREADKFSLTPPQLITLK